MATKVIIIWTLVLQIYFHLTNIEADILDKELLIDQTVQLDRALVNFLQEHTGINDVQKAYVNAKSDLQFEEVNGPEMVARMAEKLGAIFKKKLKALNASVDWAEKLAMNYNYNDTLQLGDVDYINANRVDDNDTNFTYSDKFKQRVNLNESSVHIPVEIYEGGVEILNALSWTSRLDEIWRKNNDEDPDLLWQYFGSQTGIMRNYPAQKWLSDGVDLYDVRRRPWYTQGASSPKDMLILMDTSGSSFGQTLALMKQSVKSMLSTLGENDFVYIAHFAEYAERVGCFENFVQATSRNKKILSQYVDALKAKGMASYTKGFEFAFEVLEKHKRNNNSWEGANCNSIIMFLTDGGTEMPEELFNKYNPDRKVRIFTYAVGPTASPVAAAHWIACDNRGYFSKIPAMSAIRSTVQLYRKVVSKPMALAGALYDTWTSVYKDALNYMLALPDGLSSTGKYPFYVSRPHRDLLEHVSVLARSKTLSFGDTYQWSYLLHDPRGLGMMTTATLPVYKRSADLANQTLLGVMGTDVTIDELRKHTPVRKLGPNGYAFAINNNGYIIFHPNLKPQYGWLTDPPSMDLLEVETNSAEKEEVRRRMVFNETGTVLVDGLILTPDETHVDKAARNFFFTGIPSSNFSLAIVVPDYHKYFIKGINYNVSRDEGAKLLDDNASALLLAPWTYCSKSVVEGNVTDTLEILLDTLMDDSITCGQLLQQLYFDANVTEDIVTYWSGKHSKGIHSRYVATNAGLTRIYPPTANESYMDMRDTWKADYYKRAFDNPNTWMFSATYNPGMRVFDENDTIPNVLSAHAVNMDAPENYKAAVVGLRLEQSKLRELMLQYVPACNKSEVICYLLDDGAYIVLSSDEQDRYKVGQFLGDVDRVLMYYLQKHSIFDREEMYDFQASCYTVEGKLSAGSRSFYVPSVPNMLYEMMTLSWWTSKFAWLYINFNFYNWWFLSSDAGMAEGAPLEEEGKNHTCTKLMTQYHFSDNPAVKELARCGNCSRTFATAALPNTNLLLVLTERNCLGTCHIPPLNSVPVESQDPLLLNQLNGTCSIVMRERSMPEECFDQDEREVDTDCGAAGSLLPSVALLVTASTVAMLHVMRRC